MTLGIFSILSVALDLLDDAVLLLCSELNSLELHLDAKFCTNL